MPIMVWATAKTTLASSSASCRASPAVSDLGRGRLLDDGSPTGSPPTRRPRRMNPPPRDGTAPGEGPLGHLGSAGDLARYRRCRVHRCARRGGYAGGGGAGRRPRRPLHRRPRPHPRYPARRRQRPRRRPRRADAAGAGRHRCRAHRGEEAGRGVRPLPLLYYRENVEGLRVLLEHAVEAGVGSLVFSSSAAVYGMPDVDLVGEDTECRPVNPYGTTKVVGERMTEEVAAATGLRYANLRYFNVAGAADPALTDRGVSNLVPMVFQRLTQRQAPLVFGDTHPTPDGTCIRDFVHVADIATAHVAAARALDEGAVTALTANIG